MKRKLLPFLFSFILLFSGYTTVFAADEDTSDYPIEPVTISEENSSQVTVYFGNPNVRLPLSHGSLMIEHGGTLIATASGATYATQICPLIKFFVRLYKYNPSTGVSSYQDYKNFYATDAVFCAGSHNFTVPSAGYYFLTGIHTIADETKNTQTQAIYIN